MPYFSTKVLADYVTTDKGTTLFRELLISQYESSPNLKEYLDCYFEEMDLLFEELENVYLGRFLEFAGNAQLDVLGIIVGIGRKLSIEAQNFGFLYTRESGGFESLTPDADADIFKTLTDNRDIVTLDDDEFRSVVRAKGYCNGNSTFNVESIYQIIFMLLGRVPSDGVVLKGGIGIITLELDTASVTLKEIQIIKGFHRYFTPAGYVFYLDLI